MQESIISAAIPAADLANRSWIVPTQKEAITVSKNGVE